MALGAKLQQCGVEGEFSCASPPPLHNNNLCRRGIYSRSGGPERGGVEAVWISNNTGGGS